MAVDPLELNTTDWRRELPVLSARGLALREPVDSDVSALVELLSLSDATGFGLTDRATESRVREYVDRTRRDRAAGFAFSYVVTMGSAETVVGLIHVRQLDPAFEAAEWEMTLTPFVRGTGVFVEATRLVGSFAFNGIGVHRLESRVLLQNGRANGALRKIGAVQEGVLRRSIRRGGEYLDQVLWAVVRDDWSEQWTTRAPRVH